MVSGRELLASSVVEGLSSDTVVSSVGVFAEAIEVAGHELDVLGHVLILVDSEECTVVVDGLLVGRDGLELDHVVGLLVVRADLLEVRLVGLVALLDEVEHALIVLLDDVVGSGLTDSSDPCVEVGVDVLDDTCYFVSVITTEVADDQVVLLVDEAVVSHLLREVVLVELADTYDPLLSVHAVLRGEEAWGDGQQLLLDLQVIGLCAVLLVELFEALDLTDSGLTHLEQLIGLHEADVDLDSLAVGSDDPEGGEGLDLVLLSDLDVLGSFGIHLEVDELLVEELPDLGLREDGLLHLLTGYAPGSVEVYEERLILALGFSEGFGESPFEEAYARLLSGDEGESEECYDQRGHILEVSHRERVLGSVLDNEGEEATELTAVAFVVDP